MTWKNYVAKYAGATLGFIADDFGGAAAGYYIGDYLTRTSPNMAKAFKRKRSGSTWKRRVKSKVARGPRRAKRINYKRRRRYTRKTKSFQSIQSGLKQGISTGKCYTINLRRRVRPGPSVYKENFQQICTSLAGKQGWYTLAFSGNVAQFLVNSKTGTFGAINIIPDGYWTGIDYLSMNPNQRVGQSNLDATGNVSTIGAGMYNRSYIVHATTELDFTVTNFCSSPIKADVEIWMCMSHSNDNVMECANRLMYISAPSPGTMLSTASETPFPASGVGLGTWGLGATQLEVVGTKVSEAKGLGKFWKKLGMKSLSLAVGATVSFSICVNRNKRIKISELIEMQQGSNIGGAAAFAPVHKYMKGETVQVTCLTTGAPVVDTNGATPIITTSQHEYGYICTRKETFRFGDIKDSSAVYQANAITYNVPAANAKIVGYTDDAQTYKQVV